MKLNQKLTAAFLLILLVFMSACSKDDDTNEPIAGTASDYYPGAIGSSFTYSTDTINTSTGSAASIGSRVSTFDRNEAINGIQYIIQKNTSTLGGLPFYSKVGFRRSDTEVSFAIDTSGIASMIDSAITATGYDLQLDIDSEILVIKYPLYSGLTWDAFKLSVGLGSLISIPVIRVTAEYMGQESVSSVPGGAATAEKIKYKATIQIPTSADDILNPPTEVFEATGWFAKGVGLVKIEGSAIILSAISVGEIDIEDTRVVRETLTQYTVK